MKKRLSRRALLPRLSGGRLTTYLVPGLATILSMIALALLQTAAGAGEPPGGREPATGAAWTDSMTTWMQPYVERRDFSGVVLVSEKGRPAGAYIAGSADRERDRGPTLDTPFAVGSISKQFTAVAIALLEERGGLSADDTVSRHLLSFAHGDSITIRNLLEHRSGLVDIYALPGYGRNRDRDLSLPEVVAMIGDQPLLFPPGSDYVYCNSGYAVAAAIVEQVSGLPLAEFLEQEVFGPLGMGLSGCLESGRPEGLAVGYDPIGPRGLVPAPVRSASFLVGSGSVYSTASDLARWAAALQEGTLLSAPSSEKVLRREAETTSYAYGLTRTERSGRPVVCHDGRIAGYSADLAVFLEEPVSIVVLSNVQSVARDDIRFAASDFYFGEPVRPARTMSWSDVTPPVSELQEFAGAYSFGPGLLVTVFVRDGSLFARANEGEDSEFVLREDGRFFSRTLYSTIRFERDESGRVVSMLYGNGSQEWPGARQE